MIRPILMRMMTMLQQSCGKKYCRIGFASCLVLLVIIISIVVRNNNNDYEYAPYQIPQPYHHHPDTGKYVIPNQYVIIFYSNVEGASYDIGDGILQRYQKQYPTDYKNEMPTIIHDYDSVYKGVTIMNVSDNLLQYILQEQVVKHIDEDVTYVLDTIQYDVPSWGLDRIDQTGFPLDGIFRTEPEDVDATANGDSANNAMINAGEDVYVFVFDSGIDSTHIEFNHNSSDNRVKCPFNAFKFDSDSQPDSNNDINYAEDHICYDKNGHGTYTAGIIGGYTYGVAKAVQLVSIKITKNNEDTTSIGALIAGIDYVISLQQRNVTENMPIVLNFSLGGPPKIAFKMAIDIAIEHGMIVVASAGNHDNENDDDGGTGVVPSACSRSPANMDNVITVGSTNQNDERAQFSNTGECLTLYAPGHAITSSHSGSTTKTLSAEEEQNVVFDSKAAGANNKYITRSGTSASAAYVAGALALYLQYNPDMSSHEAKNWLTSSAIKHITIDGGTLLILNIQPIQDI